MTAYPPEGEDRYQSEPYTRAPRRDSGYDSPPADAAPFSFRNAPTGSVYQESPVAPSQPQSFGVSRPSPLPPQSDDTHTLPALRNPTPPPSADERWSPWSNPPPANGSLPPKATARVRPPSPPPGNTGSVSAGAKVPSPPPPHHFDSPPKINDDGTGSPHDLIPGPDETALLPQIPADPSPAPEGAEKETRSKRGVKRHRGGPSGPAEFFRKGIRGGGELLVTFGVIVLLFAAYEIWGVSAQINSAQNDMASDLDDLWAGEIPDGDDGLDGAPVPEMGDAFARMWAPDIREEPWVLVEGTDLSDIEWAPGRWEEGAYPGEQGNMTLAGHNVPAIFQRIRELEEGDKVVLETRDNFYVYEVQFHHVVDDTAMEILSPVPPSPDGSYGGPGQDPGENDYWLTLFTCHPLWDNTERYVVTAQLSDTLERGDEMPDEAIDPNA